MNDLSPSSSAARRIIRPATAFDASSLFEAAIAGKLGKYQKAGDYGLTVAREAQRQIAVFLQESVLYAFVASSGTSSHTIANSTELWSQAANRRGLAFRKVEVSLPQLHKLQPAEIMREGEVTANASDTQREVIRIIQEAAILGATDIHIHIIDDIGRIFYRVHRERHLRYQIEHVQARQIMESILQFCDNSGAKMAEQQGTTASFSNASTELTRIGSQLPAIVESVRIGMAPSHFGGSQPGKFMALRLAKDASLSSVKTLGTGGFHPWHIRVLRAVLRRPSGGMFFSGPMNSGKTTSLAILLETLIDVLKEAELVICGEDPTERRIRGAVQWNIAQGSTREEKERFWENAFTLMLRLDANKLMLGEIRDRNSAQQAFINILNGLKLFTTVHAMSGLGVLGRLGILKVDSQIYTDHELVSCIGSQRLVPTICPHCSRGYADVQDRLDPAFRERMATLKVMSAIEYDSLRFRNRDGCDKCLAGLSGETIVAEVFETDEELMELYRSNQRAAALRYVRDDRGMLTMLQHALIKIRQGLVDPDVIDSRFVSLDPRLLSDRAVEHLNNALAAQKAAIGTSEEPLIYAI